MNPAGPTSRSLPPPRSPGAPPTWSPPNSCPRTGRSGPGRSAPSRPVCCCSP
ncbi:hypothetical protein V2I01_08055 [Micromonospora sp. BRA006-A]|nr:hypothetical protein [Micromonospora sp. BRA006-A]